MRRLAVGFVGASAVVLSALTVAPASADPLPSGYVNIQNTADRYCLGTLGTASSSSKNGARVVASTCDDFTMQYWRYVKVTYKKRTVYEIQQESSKKCLQVVGSSKADHARIDIQPCDKTAASQLWTQGTSAYETASVIENVHAADYLIPTLGSKDGATAKSGAPVQTGYGDEGGDIANTWFYSK